MGAMDDLKKVTGYANKAVGDIKDATKTAGNIVNTSRPAFYTRTMGGVAPNVETTQGPQSYSPGGNNVPGGNQNYNDPFNLYATTQNRLTSPDPRTIADRQSAGRRDSARQYQARLQAREASAKQGYGAGTAQASRLQKEAMSPVLKAGVAEQANISDQQRKYYEGALKQAWEQTLNSQTRHDVEFAQANTLRTLDENSAQMILNNIQDPVRKGYLSAVYGAHDDPIEGAKAMKAELDKLANWDPNSGDPDPLPRMDSPAMTEWKGIQDEIKQLTHHPVTGDEWDDDGRRKYLGELWTDFIKTKYQGFKVGGGAVDRQNAVTNIKTSIKAGETPSLEDVTTAYDSKTVASWGDGGTRYKDLVGDNEDGWYNLEGEAVKITGERKFGDVYQIDLELPDGRKFSYNPKYKRWYDMDSMKMYEQGNMTPPWKRKE